MATSPSRESQQPARSDGSDQEQTKRLLRARRFQQVIDQQIEEARVRGRFDNLRGKGKPLDLTVQPGEQEGTWAIHRVLREADFAPPWVLLAKEIDEDLATCKAILERVPLASKIRRRELLEEYRRLAHGTRDKTIRYNLMVPSHHLQRPAVHAQALIQDMERAVESC